MASISTDPKGRKRVQFIDGDGERKTVRPGKMSNKAVQNLCTNIEHILEARFAGTALDPDVARWLADRPDRLYAKLVAVGLAEPRANTEAITLGALFKAFFAAIAVKPATMVRMEQAKGTLIDHFTEDRDVATITPGDADEWRAALAKSGYATATVSRTVLYARQFFKWAIRRGLATVTPSQT